jgi:branched-chain amino acid transport system permease protein
MKGRAKALSFFADRAMTASIVIQLLVAGLSIGSIYALVGLGLVLAFKGTGILNFAHGELVALGAYVALFLTVILHLPYWQVFILSLVIMALIGAAFERVLIKPLLRAPSFTIVVATMAIGLMIKNALRLSWQESIATLPSPLDDMSFRIGEVNINPQYLWIIGCSILITASLALFFRKNLTGKALQAVAQNQEAARLMGIRVSVVFPLTFAISSVLAGLAGILFSPLVGIQPEMSSIILKGFVAAILGGINSLLGCVVGGLLLGILETFGGAFIGGTFKDVTAFVILMAVLLFRPNGIFGKAEARRV